MSVHISSIAPSPDLAQAPARQAEAATESNVERWPVPQAAMLIFTLASALWIGIYATARAVWF